MSTIMRGLVLAGVSTAVLAVSIPPAAATDAQKYNSVRLQKVWTPNKTDRCLSMNGSKKTGATLILAACNRDKTQKWTLKRATSGTYTVKNDKSGKCLHVANNKTGTKVTQQPCKRTNKKQQWVLSGSKIISKHANKTITSKVNTKGSKPFLDKVSAKKRAQQEWGLS
ncbi:RICIN domain-containing protein [Streptomyces sp. NPDC014894]|uniref:RICIN domain-containing protein n=1 Tax=Streptomyces sp. NPDC014894 TaxID=3364931 RepID=UPI003700AF99